MTRYAVTHPRTSNCPIQPSLRQPTMIPGSSGLALNRSANAGFPRAYEAIPHPDSLWSSRWNGHAYVVTVGLKVGIFRDWTEAGLYVTGIPCNIHKEYTTFDEAFEVYKQRYEERAIRIVPGEPLDRPADGLQSISTANFLPVSPNPFIPRPEDLPRPAWGVKSGPFYVVTIGRGVGIYEDW